jgi:hypothetical protein
MKPQAMLKKIPSIIGLLLLSSYSNANELLGFWQHESQPVIVEILVQDDSNFGIIRQQTKRPEAVGKTLYQDLVYNDKKEHWQGQIYVFRMKEFKDVTLTMLSEDEFKMTVKVGFMSRSFNWIKVEAPE